MTQATFIDLLEPLHPNMECQDTTMLLPFPTDTWLAIALLKLATSTNLHYVGHLFGMGKANTGEDILEVCSALQD
ncbi:hypothetical protein Y1Q_0018323 [Alligator mississippiensis]|uniref:Uncharacterized protein n=1 Tax=Alligator mississippiensis TaxID=8496 RepID=A0A151PBW4_ALLMI|nr:hypothetical protein Y1Q_0018323 [Alligator mississippiensis]